MALSLYDASVANYLQTLGAVSGFLDRGLAYFRESNIDPETIVEALGHAPERPAAFAGIESLPQRYERIAAEVDAVKACIAAHGG